MGWSIDIVRGELDKIFKNLEADYEIQHPDSNYPTIYFICNKELPPGLMKHIAGLFPDDVYIYFQTSSFPVEKPL